MLSARDCLCVVAFLSWRWSSNKKSKKGEEKKEDFRGFTMGTQPTTPDRHVPTGSAPRGRRSRVLLLSAESYVFFRGFIRF